MIRKRSRVATVITLAALAAMPLLSVAQTESGGQTKSSSEDPFETIRKLSSSVRASHHVEPARTRCLAKQKTRLEGCESKPQKERESCEAVAKELIAVCEQMNPNAPAFLADQLFCSGHCALRQYPSTGGPIPGGGGTCLGNVCASEGSVCDPGILIDGVCTTDVSVLTNTKFCSCSCQ